MGAEFLPGSTATESAATNSVSNEYGNHIAELDA